MRFSQASGTFVILQLQIAVPEGAEGFRVFSEFNLAGSESAD
jgi:hypothetical protein